MLQRLVLLLSVIPAAAHAFCGFYVAGGGASLFNDATQVVLLREGTKTVLSMQNNYRGPPQNFAMVVPVPVVLQKENVKTLTKNLFDKLDQLAAPRLVEYWEQDPCYQPPARAMSMDAFGGVGSAKKALAPSMESGVRDYGVSIEAQFTVGEYEIVVLSAKDALGLEAWLTDNQYKIPSGAAPLFRPYIQQGMKFFVAKVDVAKVKFENDVATLSPLRFHYDSEKFELPIRLGLINAKAEQDLIVHVLARERYEVANYPNVTIPTNIDLVPSAKSEFGPFYASLLDKTVKKNPKAVVTEYAWDASTCDPCPTPPLGVQDLMLLGLDVVTGGAPMPELEFKNRDAVPPQEAAQVDNMIRNLMAQISRRRMGSMGRFVITRLHARYDKGSLGDDLVFKAAPPIAGGREFLTNGSELEQGSVSSSVNNFQARYAIRYPWAGKIECSNPQRGKWGGPPDGARPRPMAAEDLGLVKRDATLAAKLVESPVPEVGLKGLKSRAGLPVKK